MQRGAGLPLIVLRMAVSSNEVRHGNTLFVTRIPYHVTNTDLETLFSDIGPLRRAFVVTNKETHKSKGVGYVTYTDAADAEKALEKLHGASIDGSKRRIQLQWADRKTDFKSGKSAELKSTPAHTAPRHVMLPDRDPDAVRTIVISGLAGCTPAADVKTIYKRVRKLGDVEQVKFAEHDGCVSNDVAHVRFRTPNHALQAINRLHAHQFKGSQLSVELKKRTDGALRREMHMRDDTRKKQHSIQEQIEQFSGKTLNIHQNQLDHASRLIVRNLPFDMSMEDLRAVFLPYGALYNISLPTDETNGKGRGFAFVWYVSKSDAAKAMEAINGVSLRHGAAEQARLKKAQGKKGREAAKEALVEVHKTAQPARPVAVDWSLSQKEWMAQAEEENDEDTVPKRKRMEESDEEDKNEESEDDDTDTKERPTLAPPEAGTTLFIRNLPYQATEQELKDLFRSFGPLRYARITVDPVTSRSRGTGFICFWKRESADALLRDAEIVHQETSAPGTHTKSNPFKVPSVITADPSAPLVARFSLHGRVLHVVRAVTRETASSLEVTARKEREKGDKRNTWLLREGVPFPNTQLAASLSDAEKERRMRSFSIRRAQLGANPSLHISKTRLAVHQLPLFVTNKMLKRLALHAVRAFNEEVKEGKRADLDKDEKDDKTLSANAKQSTGSKHRPPPSVVVQAKVVLQSERVDPLTGQGRSRGYGFLEMRSFAHALKVLRWANANRGLGNLFVQWRREELETLRAKLMDEDSDEAQLRRKRIDQALNEAENSFKSEARGVLRIEFSIENITTVRKRVLRQEQARDKASKRQKLEDVTSQETTGQYVSDQNTDEESHDSRTQFTSTLHRKAAAEKVQRELKNRSLGSLIGKKRAVRKRKHSVK